MDINTISSQSELGQVIRALRLRSAISGLVREAKSEDELHRNACRIAVESAGYRMAWIGLAQEDPLKSVRPVSSAGSDSDYVTEVQISWADSQLGHGPTGTAIREKRPIVSHDLATDPSMLPWREKALQRGYRSSIALPLTVEDRAIGAFSLYGSTPNSFPLEEVVLLSEVAKDLAYAITAIRTNSARIQALDELQIAKEEAEAAQNLKSQFLDIAAHELRTPISALNLLLEMAQTQATDSGGVDPTVFKRLDSQLDRLTRLVNDLLNASRLERGLLALNRAPTDLVALVSEVISTFQAEYPARQFKFTHSPDRISNVVDRIRIEQVITNLLDNAVKYSPDDQPIEIDVRKNAERIRLSITDHGIGISPEKHASIFSRFFRITSNETIRHPGLGLGLFICKSIVELHGGTLTVKSSLGQGSAFSFELPKEET